MKKYIVINRLDNVGVAIEDISRGEILDGVKIANDVKKGHKFALCDIEKGQKIIKYGSAIGEATCNILQGEHVHSHNVHTLLGDEITYRYSKQDIDKQVAKSKKVHVFERKNGNVGIRNELFVIPLVGCVNSQARAIVEEFKRLNPTHEGVDAVTAYTHPYGCSQLGDDHQNTKTLLQRIVKHPNAGGVLVLSLGCENNRLCDFVATLGDYDKDRVRFLIAQDVDDEIKEGVKLLLELYDVAKDDKRVEKDISCLKIGLKCGGSDGLSGITANPLVGLVSDYICAVGGTTCLTEVPEMFGAEQLLMDRASDKVTFDKIVALINNFKKYYEDNGQPCYENPSPGNKDGGITTLEDKSLGCTQKAGSSQVNDVVMIGDCLNTSGLNLLNGPGNDMVAITNLGAVGCHIVLFTTGRGTPLGGFVPTIKISTNSELAKKKANWIDFDAGSLIDDGDFEGKKDALVNLIEEVANGKLTANEKNNSRDIALFKTGVTL